MADISLTGKIVFSLLTLSVVLNSVSVPVSSSPLPENANLNTADDSVAEPNWNAGDSLREARQYYGGGGGYPGYGGGGGGYGGGYDGGYGGGGYGGYPSYNRASASAQASSSSFGK